VQLSGDIPELGTGELFALDRPVVLADPSVVGRHRWLIMLGLVVVLIALAGSPSRSGSD